MRLLLGISSQGSKQVAEDYLLKFNKQFSVEPANDSDCHRAA
jgi:hypothetical protein